MKSKDVLDSFERCFAQTDTVALCVEMVMCVVYEANCRSQIMMLLKLDRK